MDFTNIAELIEIVQIPTTKILKIELIRINANKLSRVFAYLNYKI
jgi:hypothetical protein